MHTLRWAQSLAVLVAHECCMTAAGFVWSIGEASRQEIKFALSTSRFRCLNTPIGTRSDQVPPDATADADGGILPRVFTQWRVWNEATKPCSLVRLGVVNCLLLLFEEGRR